MTLYRTHIDQQHLGMRIKELQSAIDAPIRNALGSVSATLSSNAATITSYSAKITTESLTTAHTASQALVITKVGVVAGDFAMISMVGGTNTQGVPVFKAVCTTDTVTITLTNNAIAANAFNGTFIFNLMIFKAA